MKKTLVGLILLVLFGGTVFFFGWVQFAVPAGSYGVLLSKTGGINPATIKPAEFRWQWERVIPTNATIFVFDLKPKTVAIDASGALPSAELYRAMLEGKPDFSWKMSLGVTARADPAILPKLAERDSIRDQAALDRWIDARIGELASGAGQAVIADLMKDPAQAAQFAADNARLAAAVRAQMTEIRGEGIEIVSVEVKSLALPDFALYAMASSAYSDYQNRKTALLERMSAKEADAAVAEYLQIERFSRWGELLTKYPILIDFFAVASDDAKGAFKAVKSLR